MLFNRLVCCFQTMSACLCVRCVSISSSETNKERVKYRGLYTFLKHLLQVCNAF